MNNSAAVHRSIMTDCGSVATSVHSAICHKKDNMLTQSHRELSITTKQKHPAHFIYKNKLIHKA